MAADTGDFRSSERLLLLKRLSQATCCIADIMLNSVILHNLHSAAKKKRMNVQIELREHGSSGKSQRTEGVQVRKVLYA